MIIKNPKGRLVGVTQERGQYLLDPKPVVRLANGQPKTDSNGNHVRLVKARHEEGYTLPSKEEIAAYEAEHAADVAAREEVDELQDAAQASVQAAAKLAAKATTKDQQVVGGKKKAAGRPTNAQIEADAAKKKAEEEEAAAALEATVRDADGDKAKFDALTPEGKELYKKLDLADVEA